MGLNDDLKLEIYQKGLLEGQKHQEPSPKTLIKFENFDGKMQLLEQKMDFIVSGIKDIKATLKEQNFASIEDLKEVDKKILSLANKGWVIISAVILMILEKIMEIVMK